MNTGGYGRSASCMPQEGAGRNFIPPSSTNLPLWRFFRETAVAQALRGLQLSTGKLTFHYLPPLLEGSKKSSAQLPRGLEGLHHRDLPDIPDAWRAYPTHSENWRETAQMRRWAHQGEARMQTEQSTADFQLAVNEFREFAKARLSSDKLKMDGQAFAHPAVQLAFKAFQAGRNPKPVGQLFASIREDSKYHHQIAWCIRDGIGHPFPVQFQAPGAAYDDHVLAGGVGGAYRLADVDLFVLQDGELHRVAEGGNADE
ncbi:hypothetical protein [Pseudomonas kurunegalensis]|uniref:hypothetical protein n=1 Tax=Pseudomonas kurunegalensis TaxID=485880 RepID=UPI00256FF88A|nr:hypothetical protein [Pseudomonas kurunegalensis]WJD63130.1 hypothetical protein QQ992_02180 [Pseudomonas kurunegalensis]